MPYLLRGELDVAFVDSLPNSPKLHVDVLFSDERRIILSQSHSLAGQLSIDPAALWLKP